MRPISLDMVAFGPYREKSTIDFTRLYSEGLFLISGVTGSGKTSIFDAISYALYGRASGGRNPDELKSHFVEEELCYVDFSFELGSRLIRVKRQPAQRAQGARKALVNHPAQAELYLDGKLVSDSVREVTSQLEEILGLKFEEFSQIILLPQGEFQRLLEASSGEKEEIFRRIFSTSLIESFVNRLKKREAGLRRDLAELTTKLGVVLGDSLEEKRAQDLIELLEKKVEEDQKEEKSLEKKILEAEKTRKSQDRELQSLAGKLEDFRRKSQLLESKGEMDRLGDTLAINEKARSLRPYRSSYLDLKGELEELEARLAGEKKVLGEKELNLKELLDEEKAVSLRMESLEEVEREIKELSLLEPRLVRYLEAKEEKKKLVEMKGELAKGLEKRKGELEAFNKRQRDYEEGLEKISQARLSYSKILEERASLTEEITEKSRLLEEEDKRRLLEKELEGLEEKVIAEEARLSQASRVYEDLLKSYKEAAAGLMARELEDDKPCPVCGSLHHPAPAQASQEAEGGGLRLAGDKRSDYERSLAALKEKRSQQRRAIADYRVLDGASYEKSKLHLEEANARKKSLEKDGQLAKKEMEISPGEFDRAEGESLGASIQDIKNSQAVVVSKIQGLIPILEETFDFKSLEELKKARDKKIHLVKSTRDEAGRLSDLLGQAREELAGLKASLEARSQQKKEREKALERARASYERELKALGLEAGYEKKLLEKRELEELELRLTTYRRELDGLEDRLEGLDFSELLIAEKRIKKEVEDADKDLESLREQEKELAARLRAARNNLQAAKVYHEERAQLASEYDRVSNLALVADGKKGDRVSFERYVLAAYLDRVLEIASGLLFDMTSGRYNFVRRDAAGSKGGGKKGLDIDVMDSYTGSQRAVKTLSGGESFKASLALALALGDFIQSQTSSVAMDTLLIDEGFGSLDSESLDSAIGSLMELRDRGRLVGIISHVEELKERIPQKILIEKTSRGSKLHLET